MNASCEDADWISSSSDSSSEAESSPAACATCHRTQSELPAPLKHCAKCKKTPYCSVECQKADWKTAHKKVCGKQPKPKPKPPADQHNPGFHAMNGLLGLSGNDHLHVLPEKEAFDQLIDCYRLRVEDEYKYAGETRGLYGGEDPLADFREFLDMAEKRKGILPGWWSKEKRARCERAATDGDAWADIGCAVEKSDIIDHYKDPMMPMTLRILGEKIYGKGFM
ncbi:hypothetical protein LZ554_007969 [Drepanopeziza brunnea f. sp. 'monogermtubi']|nr:hypothetical protein LZ554_007969 [Drepanopeziza brunnea f. sp. 'monogermtubi']